MNTNYGFSNSLLNRSDLGGYSVGQFNWESGSYSKTENTDITIITDDGDRVTISSDRSMEANYSSYSGLLRSGSSTIKTEGYEYQSKLHISFTMSIAGDLDSQEYDDIMSALKTIDSFVEGAYSGDRDSIRSVAEKFDGFDSLSSLSANIQIEESVGYEQGQSLVATSKPVSGKETEDSGNAEKLDHALAKILDTGYKSGKAPGKVKHLLGDYLSGLLDSLSKKTEKNHPGLRVGEIIKDMIMNRLGEKAGKRSPA